MGKSLKHFPGNDKIEVYTEKEEEAPNTCYV